MNKNGWSEKSTRKKYCVLSAQSRAFWLFLVLMYTSAVHLQTNELICCYVHHNYVEKSLSNSIRTNFPRVRLELINTSLSAIDSDHFS